MQIKEWNEIHCSTTSFPGPLVGFWAFWEQFEEASYLNIIAASSNTITENSFNRQSSLPASDTYMLARKQQTKFIPGIMTWYKCCFVRLNGYVFASGNVHQDADRLALFRGEDRVHL